ncbi:TIR domain-containing protein [Sesbania bispinosa]|nr:TIR domain-containing protein [Sesbania bispinosa]
MEMCNLMDKMCFAVDEPHKSMMQSDVRLRVTGSTVNMDPTSKRVGESLAEVATIPTIFCKKQR